MQKLNMQTPDLVDKNIEQIAKLFPSVITETIDKDGNIKQAVDFDLLRQSLSDVLVEDDNERYRLDWPGKKASLLKANIPIYKTLRPVPEESVDFENTENLFIEGDNFEALKILQESYLGKIKMIYIDPPYNTGNDLIYKDNYSVSKAEYDDEISLENEEGEKLYRNTDSNGRFHSDWLSMMYERLYIARDLLKDDGVIFISIDDNEVHNIRKLCDELFSESNRLDRGSLIWINKGSTKGFNKIVKNHEYILAYGKNSDLVKSKYGQNFPNNLDELEHYCFNRPNPGNPICTIKFAAGCKIEGVKNIRFTGTVGDEVTLDIVSGNMIFKDGILQEDIELRGAFPYRNQIESYFKNQNIGKETLDFKGQRWIEIFFNSKGLPRYRKERNTKIISSVIDEDNIPNYGSDDISNLFGKKEIFPFPKPKELIIHLLSYFITTDDIVVDYFSGSSTTAHAVMQLNAIDGGNRKFIMVQLPEKTAEDSEAYKAGYKTITEIGKERIRRAGQKIKEEQKDKNKQLELSEASADLDNLDIGFRVYKTDSSNMKDVFYHPTELIQEQLSILESNIKEDRTPEDILTQVILDLGLELSLPIEKKIIFDNNVFIVQQNALVACFDDDINFKIVDVIAELKPFKVVFKDASFKDDKDKINVEERFKRLSPETVIMVL